MSPAASSSENAIDCAHIIDVLKRRPYVGYIAVEYQHADWQGMNDVDVLSESVALRHWLRTTLAS